MEKYAKAKDIDPHGITQEDKEKLMEDMIESLYPGDNQICHGVDVVIRENLVFQD